MHLLPSVSASGRCAARPPRLRNASQHVARTTARVAYEDPPQSTRTTREDNLKEVEIPDSLPRDFSAPVALDRQLEQAASTSAPAGADAPDVDLSGSLKGMLLLNLGALLFGSNQVVIKTSLESGAGLSPEALNALRFGAAALCFAPMLPRALSQAKMIKPSLELGLWLTGASPGLLQARASRAAGSDSVPHHLRPICRAFVHTSPRTRCPGAAGVQACARRAAGYTAQAFGLSMTSASHGAFTGTFTVLAVPMLVGLSGRRIANKTWAAGAAALLGARPHLRPSSTHARTPSRCVGPLQRCTNKQAHRNQCAARPACRSEPPHHQRRRPQLGRRHLRPLCSALRCPQVALRVDHRLH